MGSSAVSFAFSAVAPEAGQGKGLDSLSDDRLLGELAQRGLDSLLERAFEVNKVPGEQRQATRALLAMREMRNPASGLTAQQREELVARVVAGMDRAMESQRDPKILIDNAEQLRTAEVVRLQRSLEYLGDTMATRARLLPVARTVSKMLARAAELARNQANDFANKMTSGADQAALDRYSQLELLAQRAEFGRRMNDYAVVAAMDPADRSRETLANDTIEGLKAFDTPDWTLQAQVRVQIGKVMLVKGDYDSAIKELDSVWPANSEVQPPPTAVDRFEARYFAAIATVKSGNIADAQRRHDAIAASIPVDWPENSRAAPEATLMVLQYEIYAAAKDDAKAREVLADLVRLRPNFEATVLEQMALRLPVNPDIKSLDSLMLRAVFHRGELEAKKAAGQAVDGKVLAQAVDAARELLGRRDKGGIDPAALEYVAMHLPTVLEKQGQKVDAATAYLDYISLFGTGNRNAGAALEGATLLVATLRKETPEDPAVSKVYERLLALAVEPPFSREDLNYPWAKRLQDTGRYAEAVKFFERVPAGDSHAALARYYRMVALKQILDAGVAGRTPMAADERKRRWQEVLSLAQQVSAEARRRTPGDTEATKNDKLILVRSALVGADVALREARDPALSIKQLDDFESAAAGLSGEKDLISQAMTLRVLARMDLGQNQEATQTLIALLEKTDGAEGAEIVFKLLTRLNEDFDKARAVHDNKQVRALAQARAELSGFLVSWAEKNPIAAIRDNTFRYRIFNADTTRLAADLETDPAARTRGLAAALSLYEGLKATSKPGVDPDPSIDLGIAVIAYDLGQYQRANDLLATMLRDRRLGRPTLEEERNGQTVLVPNDRYWEATLKLMRSTLKLVEAGKAGPEARTRMVDYLKELYARWGAQIGGPKWGPEFEALRQEIAPDYAVPDLK